VLDRTRKHTSGLNALKRHFRGCVSWLTENLRALANINSKASVCRLNESLRISLVLLERDGSEMDHVDIDRFIACPSCGAPMRFLRTIPAGRNFREMQTFECRPCRLAVTAEQLMIQFPELLSA